METKFKKFILRILSIAVLACYMIIINDVGIISKSTSDTNDDETNEYNNTSSMNTVDENGHIVAIDTTPCEDEVKVEPTNTRAKAIDNGVLRLRVKPNVNYITNYSDCYGRNGYLNGYYGGDAVYLGMVNNKVKFMISGVIGYMDAKGSDGYANYQIYSFESAKSISYYYVENGYLYHRIAKDVAEDNSYISAMKIGYAPNYLSNGTKYYSYDGIYFYTNYSTMINDINNTSSIIGVRNNAVNANNPNYNYYQYLPARSKTTITSNQINNYISKNTKTGIMLNNANAFINAQNTYGVNAQLMVAHAALESAWGTSDYATNRNNLFGINAGDADPNNASYYSSATACINAYAKYLSVYYLDPKDASGYYSAGCYGDKNGGISKGWASDPYGGEKIGAVAFDMDTTNSGNDINNYTLAIKNNTNKYSVYSEASTNSNNLYQTTNINTYPFIVQTTFNNFYKVASDAPINTSRTAIVQDVGDYNYRKSYGYVLKSSANIINNGRLTCNLNETSKPSTTGVVYSSYIDDKCWQNYVANGTTSGSTGENRAIEAIKIGINGYPGSISYQTHISNVGWGEWMSDNSKSNTEGKEQVEAIRIKLENMDNYDIEYRCYVSNSGWQAWVSDGEIAGTTGKGNAIEAIEIKIKETEDKEIENGINYSSHVQNVGWQANKSNGELSGTTGQSKRLEAIKINLTGNKYSGNVTYSAHVSNVGWQNSVSNGSIAGTTGQSKQVEAIKINLNGDISNYYDIYYRTYIEDYGWLGWAKNGEVGGTTGYCKRMEAIEIRLIKKGNSAPGTTINHYRYTKVKYSGHVQSIGWMNYVKDGELCGTSGKSKRLEAIKISISNAEYTGGIEYRAHVQDQGWQDWASDNGGAGTTKKGLRMEAIQINLTGEISKYYNVYYRVHVQDYGWLGWAVNGQISGTVGHSKRIEAIEIQLVTKGDKAPISSNEINIIK